MHAYMHTSNTYIEDTTVYKNTHIHYIMCILPCGWKMLIHSLSIYIYTHTITYIPENLRTSKHAWSAAATRPKLNHGIFGLWGSGCIDNSKQQRIHRV
jgi:hypothetical protein